MRLKFLLTCALAISNFGICEAQNGWELKKQHNGIRVYESTNSSSFKSVKVEALLEGTKQKLIKILQDVDHNHEWVYATKTSYLLQKISDVNFIYYSETALPWPMKNRDQPIHLVIHPETMDSILEVTTVGEPQFMPTTPGRVRIPHFSGTWRIKATDASHIHIDYLLNVDPGGSLPAWIANMFVAKGPLATFTKLAELLKK